jgi:hypothetical protein
MDTTDRPVPSVDRPSTGIDLLPPHELRALRQRYMHLLGQLAGSPSATYVSGVIAAIDRQLEQETA